MGLEEHELQEWVRRVAHGEASRRHFLHTMLGRRLGGSASRVRDPRSPNGRQRLSGAGAGGEKGLVE